MQLTRHEVSDPFMFNVFFGTRVRGGCDGYFHVQSSILLLAFG